MTSHQEIANTYSKWKHLSNNKGGLGISNSNSLNLKSTLLFSLLNGWLLFWCSLILILFNIKLCYVRGMLNKTFQRSFCFIRISVLCTIPSGRPPEQTPLTSELICPVQPENNPKLWILEHVPCQGKMRKGGGEWMFDTRDVPSLPRESDFWKSQISLRNFLIQL